MKIDWEFGRERSIEIIEMLLETPNEWREVANFPDGAQWSDIWEQFGSPLKYYLQLEDNIEAKVELIYRRKILYARYISAPTRRERLKRFCERLGTAWNRW